MYSRFEDWQHDRGNSEEGHGPFGSSLELLEQLLLFLEGGRPGLLHRNDHGEKKKVELGSTRNLDSPALDSPAGH